MVRFYDLPMYNALVPQEITDQMLLAMVSHTTAASVMMIPAGRGFFRLYLPLPSSATAGASPAVPRRRA
ncbi:MAG: hypothetical protein DMG65_05925 [Candidatus Angelobacter sp. Gp1-AA117]|nr:MAG: hypothetical protein DMG65_05925 [Candidatus Angelobacter sp. Gp1-AA117]